MKNYIQNGAMIAVTAPADGVTSGDGVLVGNLFGIASTTTSGGDAVTIQMEGVFDLLKLGTDTIGQGQAVYWDAANRRVTETASGNCLIGAATEAAGNGASVVRVRLNGVSTVAVA
jgi:predicted RecA/RadA family phage recombinase